MLVIRMQRTGRKGHAMFRVVVQDSRRTPTSGKIVAQLGSYDPHSKAVNLDKEKASFYLEHGAQPSARLAVLLKTEGVKLPKWVSLGTAKTGSVRNADKRRSTRLPEETPVEEVSAEAETTAPEVETAATAEEASLAEAPATDTASSEDAPETPTAEPVAEEAAATPATETASEESSTEEPAADTETA